MEAMWTRFNPVIEQLLEWVESGDIGRLTSIQASFSFVGPTEEKHRLLNKKLGGGALLDVGIYPVFLAQLFLGRPDFIQNQAVIGDTDVDVFEQILLGWEVGSLALLEASIISSSPNQAIISGTNGYIIIESDWVMSKSCKLVDKNKNEHFVEFDYPGFGYQFEIDEVNRCIEEGLLQSPNFSWQNSLDLIQTLDEIRNDIGLFYDDEDHIETMDIEEHHHEHNHHKH